MKSLVIATVFITLVSVACNKNSGPEEHGAGEAHAEHGEEAEEHGEHEAVRLTPEQRKAAGIETMNAGPGRVDIVLDVLGEVRPNGNRLAHIVPRFPGIAREVRKAVGDPVRKGETLAVIESNESLTPYEVKSLIGGVVTERHITLGEALTGDAPVFVIADLGEVWVDLSVYAKDLPLVRKGQRVSIHGAGPGVRGGGIISYVSPILSEETRTALARIELPNPEGRWRPGLFVTAHVVVEEADVPLAVPVTAFQSVGGEEVVFVEDEDGFVARPVKVGRRGNAFAEILEGLSPDEQTAIKGTFFLKSEAAKEELGGGHGH